VTRSTHSLLPAFEIERSRPANLREEDERLFRHEYRRAFEGTELYTLRRVHVTREGTVFKHGRILPELRYLSTGGGQGLRHPFYFPQLRRDPLFEGLVPRGELRRLRLQPIMGTDQRVARALQFALGRKERRVGRFQPPIEQRLPLLQQRHVIRLLLHAPRCVTLSRDIEQHQPDDVGVDMEMKIGGAAVRQLDRRQKIGRLDQRQKARGGRPPARRPVRPGAAPSAHRLRAARRRRLT